MAIVGYFDTLAQAQKLARSEMLEGLIQETYEEGQLLGMLPITVINSKSLLYNRESTLPSAAFYDIHEQIPWTAEVTVSQQEATLRTIARQSILDDFIQKTYKDPNDYKTIVLSTLRKGCMRTIEDKLIYGNNGSYGAEFDGVGRMLPADIAGGETWAKANPQAWDMGGAAAPVTLKVMRELIDAVRPKPSILLMTRTMRNTLSATAYEKGIVLSNATSQGTTHPPSDFGKRVDFFDGVPVVISDYLLDETDNTVDKDSAGTSGMSSIWALRFGSLIDGGLSLCIGGDTNGVDLFTMKELDTLEDYIAGGIRLYAFVCLAQGSSRATAVIHSIDEDGVIVG